MIKVSLVMSSFQRPQLLDLGLSSITKYKVAFPLEIVVVNDGTIDDTENVCKKYSDVLNIKYIFSGHRNKDGVKKRNPVFANNIAVKNSSGNILILSCPEIYHLNDCLNIIITPLLEKPKYLTIPEFMYFDDTGQFTSNISNNNIKLLSVGATGKDAVQMPFFMGMWKKEFVDIGGYDEDFTGYAADDNDLIDRLKQNNCKHFRTSARIVHLYHGPRCDSQIHWENPDWAYNRKIYEARRGQIIRNLNKEWGIL